jgi:hypothetical protein
MTRITDDKGNTIEVRDLGDGAKLIEMSSKHGIGELRLDAESAKQIGLALLPAPAEDQP